MLGVAYCMPYVACCMLHLVFRALRRAAAVVHSGAHLDSVHEQPDPSCPLLTVPDTTPRTAAQAAMAAGGTAKSGRFQRHAHVMAMRAARYPSRMLHGHGIANAPQVYDGSPSELKAFWHSSMSAPRRGLPCPALPCPTAASSVAASPTAVRDGRPVLTCLHQPHRRVALTRTHRPRPIGSDPAICGDSLLGRGRGCCGLK